MKCRNRGLSVVCLFGGILVSNSSFGQTPLLSQPHNPDPAKAYVWQADQLPISLYLLQFEDSTKSIDVMDYQRVELSKKLFELNSLYETKRQDIFRELVRRVEPSQPANTSGPTPLDASKVDGSLPIQELERQFENDISKIVGEVLLPHQVKLFHNMRAQAALALIGTAKAKQSTVLRELNLTEDQEKSIEEESPNFVKELDKEIKELKLKRRIEFLEKFLTNEQRQKLADLTGKSSK